MMKYYLLTFLTAALSFSSLRAQTIEHTKLQCEYKLVWVNDTTRRSLTKEDFMILKVGDKVSEFYSYNTYRVDSALQVDLKKGLSAVEILGKRASYGKKGVDYHIFKNYPSGMTTVFDVVGTDRFKYQEPMGQKWQIQAEKATINGYKAQKAICIFSGRKYTAWFTPDVPVATGPWKFSGLPGLIVKVEDGTGDFKFDLIGLHKVKDETLISLPQKPAISTTKADFQKLLIKYHKDPVAYLNATGPVKITPANGNQGKGRPYNPIEL
ncbi:GLPGLI family protein [Mucilaginibacter sp. KACC 22063]|uniref:GLPGLI family protein n=1 Tax=Mucilaginibacter sp. KACC 22063 TaxID=3025666 RepID=UPI0023669234|nr:GLPGLI family protein [Mucilaginibacter sp. KACC 22063]WDF57225.1 GLPGLI family protein [Mucilaginibacter sp. KACC 22063]